MYGLALGFVAMAMAAPTAAASMRPYANPTIDGGYGVAADPDSTPIIGGEKAYGFELPSPTSPVMLRSLRGDGLIHDAPAASASSSSTDWSDVAIGLTFGVAVSLLFGTALLLAKNRRTTTVAHT